MMGKYSGNAKHVKNINPENQSYRQYNARKVNSARFPDGYLYLLRMDGFDIYKIGVSRNPDRRIADIQSANPFHLIKLAVIKYNQVYELEELVLDKFKENIIKGEWFNSYPEDISQLLNCLNEIKQNENGTTIGV